MEIFKQIAPLKTFLEGMKSAGKTLGLVPTMGALHRGHISLIESSKASNSLTLASIYVNPAQFNNAQDLVHYPKTLEQDIEMLEKVGCDVIFCPEDVEMYAGEPQITLDFGPLGKVMEGKFRPGHFSGVALVVSKLFNIVQPHRAYFGQKDWQQFAVISRMVDELKFNLELFCLPIVREPGGLAMSSRNARLSGSERVHAEVLYRALVMARNELKAGKPVEAVKLSVKNMVDQQPDMQLQYFELAESRTLRQLEHPQGTDKPILCIAGFAGEVRLIDNLFLD